jgi:hypothetical protein
MDDEGARQGLGWEVALVGAGCGRWLLAAAR